MKLSTHIAGLLLFGSVLSLSVEAEVGRTPDSGSTTGIGNSPGGDGLSDSQRGTSDLRGKEMAKLDKDNDGKLSADEAKADATWSKRFKEMDSNADGMVEPSELLAMDRRKSADQTGKSSSSGGKDSLPTPSY
ncbi:MAG: hypothetical protein ACT4PZ_05510 [Panacagrimonas sp.]